MHSNRSLFRSGAHIKETIGLQQLCRPGYSRKENMQLSGMLCPTNGLPRVYLDDAEAGKWALYGTSQKASSRNHLEFGFHCDAECSVKEVDDALQFLSATVKAGDAVESGKLTQMHDGSCFERMQKPTTPVGALHLGLCGNALIMRVGSDTRCFHHQTLSSSLVNLEEYGTCSNIVYASDFKSPGWSRSKAGEHISVMKGRRGLATPRSELITTKSRGDRNRVLQNKKLKTGLTRDLYESSPFHLLEALFCFQHSDPNAVASKFQVLSRKTMKELVNALNQAAIGFAGIGATWILFVGSRVICLDGFFSRHTILSLAIGCGFLWLSWTMRRVLQVLMCPAMYCRSRIFQQDYMIRLKNEVHRLTLSVILLVVVCFMGRGSLL